jgi:alanyl-tRNA synthetase
MGLERLTTLLQGKDSNYKTDLFVPIISFTRDLISLSASDKETEISLKVIADHTRALTFLISDGVIPANDGRGYVLRRLLRRAARHGKMLGFIEPFIHKVSNKVIDLMGQAYPELYASQNFISEIILSEEKRFNRTLTSGLKRFENILADTINNNKQKIPGKELFKLSDTYGFPIDFAIDLATEKNIDIDIGEYENKLNDQKNRSRQSLIIKKNAVKQLEDIDALTSVFIGYEEDKTSAKVIGLYEQSGETFEKVNEIKFVDSTKKHIIVFDNTPFYAESGGQKGDIGIGENQTTLFSVYDTQKSESGVFLHYVKMQKGLIKIEDTLDIKIDKIRRQNISIHHSLTHLLHAALRETLGNHIKQSGSLVEQNKLRFDFTHYKSLSNEEIIEIENLINAKIRENLLIKTESLQYEEAVKQGAIAIFNEKYSDIVRLVKMGNFSKELCGGTHLNSSGEIGVFKIMNESSISSGIRRIEAVGGQSAFSYIQEKLKILEKIQGYFEKKPEKLFNHLKDMNEKLKLKKKENKKSTSVIDIKTIIESSVSINSVRVAIALIENVERKQLSTVADEISSSLNGIAILFSNFDKKSMVIVSIVNKITNTWSADVIIKKIAPLFNGRGGGKKNFAQAGGNIVNNFKSLQNKIIDILK